MLTGKSHLVPNLKEAAFAALNEFFNADHPNFSSLMMYIENAPEAEAGTTTGGWVAVATFLEQPETAQEELMGADGEITFQHITAWIEEHHDG